MTSVAFLGSHPLGKRCLELLHQRNDVSVKVVLTYPPDHEGWWNGSVYDLASELGYPILTISEEQALRDYSVEYILSVYYPNVLDPGILAHPSRGALNLHQAELPRYRGSNVFSHAILNARSDEHWRHGTTFHFMAEDVDAGDIVARKFVPITETDTAKTLSNRTRAASIALFEEVLPAIASGDIDTMGTPQGVFDGKRYFHTKDSLADEKEIATEALRDTGSERCLELYDRVRALDFPPFEPAYITVGDCRIYLTARSYADYVEVS